MNKNRMLTSLAVGALMATALDDGIAADPDYRSPSQRAKMTKEEEAAYFAKMDAKEQATIEENNRLRQERLARQLEQSKIRHDHFVHNQRVALTGKAGKREAKKAEKKAAKQKARLANKYEPVPVYNES